MVLTNTANPIKRLQTALLRGTPLDNRDLAKVGVSSALAHHYVESGWLVRLGRGVFMFPNDTLRQNDILKFLARRIEGFHVGGKTALAWRGVRHNLPTKEPLLLFGTVRAILPGWFLERFPARYSERSPFSKKLPKKSGLQPLPETPDGVLVSVPERALLEMLNDVGVHQSVEEARNIMEGVRTLRPEVLTNLLKHCQKRKALLLCVSWAQELNLPWASAAKEATRATLGQSRWSNRLKDGRTLTLKP